MGTSVASACDPVGNTLGDPLASSVPIGVPVGESDGVSVAELVGAKVLGDPQVAPVHNIDEIQGVPAQRSSASARRLPASGSNLPMIHLRWTCHHVGTASVRARSPHRRPSIADTS